MPKRYRRKSRFRRKRRFRKRGMSKFKKTTYDGIYYQKCQIRHPANYATVPGHACTVFHWNFYDAAGAANNDVHLGRSPEFLVWRYRFASYKVKGIKIEWCPCSIVADNSGANVIWFAS